MDAEDVENSFKFFLLRYFPWKVLGPFVGTHTQFEDHFYKIWDALGLGEGEIK